MPRINRAIELLEQGQPIYYSMVEDLSYNSGRREAQTWADYLTIDLEHQPFSTTHLLEFMRGLIAGGPTRSGHRTPAVVVTLPVDAVDEASMRANMWMVKQALAVGVHGLLLCHVEDPAAVKVYVEAARYSFQTIGIEQTGQGRRGSGGQALAAEIWGVPVADYLTLADVWPLNPAGELMLGLKIENHRALAHAEASTAVPGIAFAEWGPGDMGMSYGYPEAHDPPYPEKLMNAQKRVKRACDQAGIAFLNMMNSDDVIAQLDAGVKIGATTEDVATIGRQHTQRTMPY